MPFIDLQESQDRRLQMLLQTANQIQQNKIAREELALKKQQLDPEYQRRQLAQTIGILNPDAAVRLFGPTQGQAGTALPSQIRGGIPDYLGAGRASLTSGSVGMAPTKASVKVGGTNISLGTPALNEYDKANLDIAKGVAEEGAKNQQKTAAGAERTSSSLSLYLDQFKRSRDELRKFDPNIESEGTSGWFSRRGGDLANYFDQLPETAALESMAKPFAQEIATQLEGRATDQDRNIQTETFANVLKGPSTKNIRLASNSLINLYRKGAKIDKILNTLDSTGDDVMQAIAKQVYQAEPGLKPVGKSESSLDDIFKGL